MCLVCLIVSLLFLVVLLVGIGNTLVYILDSLIVPIVLSLISCLPRLSFLIVIICLNDCFSLAIVSEFLGTLGFGFVTFLF